MNVRCRRLLFTFNLANCLCTPYGILLVTRIDTNCVNGIPDLGLKNNLNVVQLCEDEIHVRTTGTLTPHRISWYKRLSMHESVGLNFIPQGYGNTPQTLKQCINKNKHENPLVYDSQMIFFYCSNSKLWRIGYSFG